MEERYLLQTIDDIATSLDTDLKQGLDEAKV